MPSTIPFSVRLEPELKERLEQEAKAIDRPASYLIVKAIKSLLTAKDEKRKAIQEAVKRANEGVFVSEEAVDAWVDSWGTDNELPIPKPDVFLNKK